MTGVMAPLTLTDVAKALGTAGDVEVHTDQNEVYLTLGHATAVVVTYDTDEPDEDASWYATAMAWAPDHGVSAETEVCPGTNASECVTSVLLFYADYRADEARMEAAMAGAPE